MFDNYSPVCVFIIRKLLMMFLYIINGEDKTKIYANHCCVWREKKYFVLYKIWENLENFCLFVNIFFLKHFESSYERSDDIFIQKIIWEITDFIENVNYFMLKNFLNVLTVQKETSFLSIGVI